MSKILPVMVTHPAKTKLAFPSIEADLSQRLAELTQTLFHEVYTNRTIPPGFNFNELQAQKYGCYQFTLDASSDETEAKAYWARIMPVFEKTFGKEKAQQVFQDFRILCPDGVEIFAYAEGASSYPRYEFCGDMLLRFTYAAANHLLEHQSEKASKFRRRKESIIEDETEQKEAESTVEQINKCVALKENIKQAFDKAQARLKKLGHTTKSDILEGSATPPGQSEQKVKQNTLPTYEKLGEEAHFEQLKTIIQNFDTTVIIQLAHLGSENPIPTKAELKATRDGLKKYQQLPQSDRSLNRDLFRMDFKPKLTSQKIQLYLRHIAKTRRQRGYDDASLRLETTSTPHGNAATLPNFAHTYEGTWKHSTETNQPLVTIGLESTRAGSPMDNNRMLLSPQALGEKGLSLSTEVMTQASKALDNFQQLLQMLRASAIERTISVADEEKKLTLSENHQCSQQLADRISQQMITNSQTGSPIDDTFKIIKRFIGNDEFKSIHPFKYHLYGLSDQIVRPTVVYTHLILTSNPEYHNLELKQWKICRLNQYLLDQRTQGLPYRPGLIYFLLPINPISHVPVIQPQVAANNRANLVQLFLLFKAAFPKNQASKIAIDMTQFQETRQALSQAALAFYKTNTWQETRSGEKRKYKAKEKEFFNASQTILDALKKYLTNPTCKLNNPEDLLLQMIFKIFLTGTWVNTYGGLLPALIHLLVNFISQTESRLYVRALGGCRSANDRMQLVALALTGLAEYGQHRQILPSILQVDDQLSKLMDQSARDFPFNLSHIQTIFSNSGMPKTSDWFGVSKPFRKAISDQSGGFFSSLFSPSKQEDSQQYLYFPKYKSFLALSKLAPHTRAYHLGNGLIPHPNFQFWYDHLKGPAGLKESINQKFYQYCAHSWLLDQDRQSIAQSIKEDLTSITPSEKETAEIAKNWLFFILNYDSFLTNFPDESYPIVNVFYLQSDLYLFQKHQEPLLKSSQNRTPKKNLENLFTLYQNAVSFKYAQNTSENRLAIHLCDYLLILNFSTLDSLVGSISKSASSMQNTEAKESIAPSSGALTYPYDETDDETEASPPHPSDSAPTRLSTIFHAIWGNPSSTPSPEEDIEVELGAPRHHASDDLLSPKKEDNLPTELSL